MIYIEKDTPTRLDSKFHNNHNIAVIIYDQFVEIGFNDSYSEFKKFTFDIDPKKYKLIEELNTEKINALDWLKANDQKNELCLVLSRHIFMSVLSDFCSFIYESLQAAMKGKMTVAYSLLRKPLQDELFIFEQLLINKEEFIDKFYNEGKPEYYDPSSWNKSLDRFKIISSAREKVNSSFVMDAKTIYDLRYDKSSPSGLHGITNRAIHLVTTHKEYRTEDQSLNFVFPSEKQHGEMWEHYYLTVPLLLIYAAAIVDQLVQELIQIDSHKIAIKSFSRMIAVLLMSDDLIKNPSSKEFFDAIKNIFSFPCFKCEKEFQMELADLDLFFHSNHLLCPNCLMDMADSPAFKQKVRDFENRE